MTEMELTALSQVSLKVPRDCLAKFLVITEYHQLDIA